MKPIWIPMRDDHERELRGVVLRLDANEHAERRETNSATDQRVPERQRRNQLCGREQGRGVQLSAGGSGSTGICQPGQRGSRDNPSLQREGHRIERAPGNKADPAISRNRCGRIATLRAAAISEKIHGPGHHSAGGNRPGARMAERNSHALHSAAGVRAVRQTTVCAEGQRTRSGPERAIGKPASR